MGEPLSFLGIPIGTVVALRGAPACGLRQGAVNAGGSQVGIPGRGVERRPFRFHPSNDLPEVPQILLESF